MKIIKEPERIAVCNRCRAVLGFDQSDVNTTKYAKPIKFIICPCCGYFIEIWSHKNK